MEKELENYLNSLLDNSKELQNELLTLNQEENETV